jgi:hypothetical protein
MMKLIIGRALFKYGSICVALVSALLSACGGDNASNPLSGDPAIAEAKANGELNVIIEELKQAGWEVASFDAAEVERFKAPLSTTSDTEIESTRVVLHVQRVDEKSRSAVQFDLYFAPGNGAEPAIAFNPRSADSVALLEDESRGLPAVEATRALTTDQNSGETVSAVAASCGREWQACPCCAGLYCGYHYSSMLHCYCERSPWTCRYTSSWGSGSGACRSRENPGGIYHVVTWRTGCQNGTGWYADWAGNGIICPQPQTASGGYPVCGRPK